MPTKKHRAVSIWIMIQERHDLIIQTNSRFASLVDFKPQTLIRNLDQPHFCFSFNKHRLHTTDEINTSLKPCQFFLVPLWWEKIHNYEKFSFCPSASTKTPSQRCLCRRKQRCEGLFVWIMEILWFIRHSSRSKSSSKRDSEEAAW